MKIVLFTETYLPFINGVVTHVVALKGGLEKLGHTVLVVTACPSAKQHYIKDNILYCPSRLSKRIYNYGLAAPFSRERLKILQQFNPDIIHIHSEFGIGLSGALMSKHLNVPMVYTLHTMYDEYLYYISKPIFVPVLKKMSHRYVRYLADKASALTGPSQKVQEYFDLCGVNKRVNIIPNPVELDLFSPSNLDKEKSKQIRDKYNILDDEILVSFCGRLGKEKSVDVLLDYWSKQVKKEDKFKLMILGEGPCLEELKQQAKQLDIDDIVIFVGRVEHNELPNYYGACQLYITASLSDTNSISMKEAMATGLPVIHIVDPLNKGQVIDGVNGYIYHDDKEMYQILVDYKNMSEEEKKIIKKSVIESVKIYGCEAIAEYLEKIYYEVTNEKKEELAI